MGCCSCGGEKRLESVKQSSFYLTEEREGYGKVTAAPPRNPDNKPSFEQLYERGEELGQGAFAVIYSCTHRVTKQQCAAKVLRQSFEDNTTIEEAKQMMRKEASLLLQLDHPHIVKVHDLFESKTVMVMVMELLSGCELFEAVSQLKGYSESTAAKLIMSVLEAIKFMHDHCICHRDIKPENIVLRQNVGKLHPQSLEEMMQSNPDEVPESPLTTSSGSGKDLISDVLANVTVIDFGLAEQFEDRGDEGTSMTEVVGSLEYTAPEVFQVGMGQRECYNEKCDLWSIGVMSYVVLSGFPPFYGRSPQQITAKVLRGKVKFWEGTVWDKITPEAKNFVAKLLSPDPAQRPSAEEAMEHPWFKSRNIQKPRLMESQKLMRNMSMRMKAIGHRPAARNGMNLMKAMCRRASHVPTQHNSLSECLLDHVLPPQPRELLSVTDNLSLAGVFQILSRKQFLSCPVVDNQGAFVTIVDVLDMVSTLMQALTEKAPEGLRALSTADKHTLLRPENLNLDEPVAQSIKGTGRTMVCGPQLINRNTSLLEVIQKGFLEPVTNGQMKNCHRIILLGEDPSRFEMVTQSDVIQFLHHQPLLLGDLGDKTLEELSMTQHPVVQVYSHTTTLDALLTMSELGLTGIAITNAKGAILGTFSATDLRGFTAQHLPLLTLSVVDFQMLGLPPIAKLHGPLVCEPTTTLRNVVELLATKGYHRIYVVDASQKPISVVTITDIMRAVENHFK